MQNIQKDHTLLDIEGMTDEAAVTKVAAALQGLAGVTTAWVRIGAAAIKSENQPAFLLACAAIRGAGHKIRRASAIHV